MIVLTLKEQPRVPLEAEVICPDVMAQLGHDEIRALPVFLGKRQRRLDDFFEIHGAASTQIEIRGDAGRVKWIGRGMTSGQITIIGNVGMHLGATMKGGRIDVSGNASDWVGAEMSGGLIRVGGNAGGQIGAAYRGGLTGMRDGIILIEGSAGLEVGMRMKRGTIVVRKAVKDFAGLEMKGGTLILGSHELRTGAWMFRGTIICLSPVPLLPTFGFACRCNPTFMRLLAAQLQTHQVALPYAAKDGKFFQYHGDTAVSGKGELFQWQPHA